MKENKNDKEKFAAGYIKITCPECKGITSEKYCLRCYEKKYIWKFITDIFE